jgi:hypothetical protein
MQGRGVHSRSTRNYGEEDMKLWFALLVGWIAVWFGLALGGVGSQLDCEDKLMPLSFPFQWLFYTVITAGLGFMAGKEWND